MQRMNAQKKPAPDEPERGIDDHGWSGYRSSDKTTLS